MILLAELLDLLALLAARQIRAQTAVGLGLTNPLAQHLVTDAEIARDRRYRPARLERQTDTTLDQLLWILPGSGHEPAVPCSRNESSFQSLRETQASSIGLLPLTTGAFAPANIADLLDMLIVHEYPTTGQAPTAVSLIGSFAACHKPVLLGETFMLTDDATTQRAFLTDAARYLAGALEFFNGHTPADTKIHTVSDAIYQASLQQFLDLRDLLLAG